MKRRNVFLVVLFSFLTLGIYIGYWFLNRKRELKVLGENDHVPTRWWIVFTIYLAIAFVLFFIDAIIFTPYGMVVIESINTILVYYFLGLLYYSVFRVKEWLESYYEDVNVHYLLLFFFHIWYLQVKMNQLEDGNLATSQAGSV